MRIIDKWNGENDGKGLIDKLMTLGTIFNFAFCRNCPDQNMILKKSRKGRGVQYKWGCGKTTDGKRCYFSSSLTSATIFDNLNKSLVDVCKFASLWIRNVPMDIIKKEIGMSNVRCLQRLFLSVVKWEMIDNMEPIGGPGKIVEIDESKFGKRKYHKGHRVKGQWVFGGYERGSGRVFAVPVKNRKRRTLIPIIKRWILPGTEIQSDCWKAYLVLGAKDSVYKYLTVNHTKYYTDPKTGACTNHIEASWRPMKADIKGSSRRAHFFEAYLAKYMFNKRCSILGLDRYEELMKAAGRYALREQHLKEEELEDSDSDSGTIYSSSEEEEEDLEVDEGDLGDDEDDPEYEFDSDDEDSSDY